jgi:hypothetical protein
LWDIIHPIKLQRKFFFSPRIWALDFLNRCSEMERTTMVVTMWHLWDARNKAREGEPMMHPNSVAEKALAYIEMIATHFYKPSHRCEFNSSIPKWSPPPIGSVMINVDVAIFSSTRSMGLVL